jgi:hypothetical protein
VCDLTYIGGGWGSFRVVIKKKKKKYNLIAQGVRCWAIEGRFYELYNFSRWTVHFEVFGDLFQKRRRTSLYVCVVVDDDDEGSHFLY